MSFNTELTSFVQYTVETGTSNSCFQSGCNHISGTAIIRAPNVIDHGITYYCAFDDDCADDKGHENWVQGPAGGPPSLLATPKALQKRQGCVPSGSCTKLEGNGDPHQWILHKQISEKRDCGDTYCVVAEEHEIDYSIKANTHGLDWISGGFAVEKEIHTGRPNFGCTGGGQQPGNSVCTWATLWHTDYTVRPGIANSCDLNDCQESGKTGIIRSPNSLHEGQIEYYCAYDADCGEQGQEIWNLGPAIPPPAVEKRQSGPAIGPSVPRSEPTLAAASLTERQDCNVWVCAELEGNGDPHQWILRKQLSDTLTCGGEGDGRVDCGMTDGDQIATELFANSGDTGVWIDGGFEVSESVWTGKYWGDCKAKPGDRVCVWAEIWHTSVSILCAPNTVCLKANTSYAVHRPRRSSQFL